MVTLLATETEAVRRAYSNATASLFVGETTQAEEAKKRTLAFVQAVSLTSRQLETTTYNVGPYVFFVCTLCTVGKLPAGAFDGS